MPDLVEGEERDQLWFEDMCPCCLDRLYEIEESKRAKAYVDLYPHLNGVL
jgi:hypothetical protein